MSRGEGRGGEGRRAEGEESGRESGWEVTHR